MSERIRQMTGGHRCEHGSLRGAAEFQSYAGAMSTCTCCRSPYGYLGDKPERNLCRVCLGEAEPRR